MYSFNNNKIKAILIDEKDLSLTKEIYGEGEVSESNSFEELFEKLNIKPNKLYAVKEGKIKGIFFNWDICKSMVLNYSGAIYKSFIALYEAEAFLANVSESPREEIKGKEPVVHKGIFAYVDGSYNAETKVYGYGVVLDVNGERYEFFGNGDDPEMAVMRNVSGEILGATRAIQEAMKMGLPKLVIYYDYQGIESWANGDWKRNKKYTIKYHEFVQGARKRIQIEFKKVKAHTGVELNEVVDKLAKKAVGII